MACVVMTALRRRVQQRVALGRWTWAGWAVAIGVVPLAGDELQRGSGPPACRVQRCYGPERAALSGEGSDACAVEDKQPCSQVGEVHVATCWSRGRRAQWGMAWRRWCRRRASRTGARAEECPWPAGAGMTGIRFEQRVCCCSAAKNPGPGRVHVRFCSTAQRSANIRV